MPYAEVRDKRMSKDKIEKILATYEPVDDKPGYVWFSRNNYTIVKLSTLRKSYEEYFAEKVQEIKEDKLTE